MNLYSIDFLHASPKDAEYGMKCLLLAENNEQVYEFIKSEPELPDGALYNNWEANEEEEFDIYDDNYEIVGKETFKEKMIRLSGEINDEDYDFSDAYYGITLFGWSLLKENVTTNYAELIELGIMYCA